MTTPDEARHPAADEWIAPVRLTPRMLRRMIGNGYWGDMTREEVEQQIRTAWAEARYAYRRDEREAAR